MQLADLPMLMGIATLLPGRLVIDNYIRYAFYFVVYTVVVGALYFLLYLNVEFIKQPFNYCYCLACLVFVAQVSRHPKFVPATLYTLLASLVMQFRVFQVMGFNVEQARFTLMFNNPNQLGLWATTLLVFASFLLLYYKQQFGKSLLVIGCILLSLFYIFLSISQAAIISAALIAAILLWYFRSSKWIYIGLCGIALVLFVYQKELHLDDIQFLANVQARVEQEVSQDDGDNGLEGRNYLRLSNFPQYLFLGAGEGEVRRFGTKDVNEIHSTYANVVFSYGIIGLILFGMPTLNFIRRKPLIVSALLGAYLIFTVVHNTLRWPLFWILPYLLYTLQFPVIPKTNTTDVRN